MNDKGLVLVTGGAGYIGSVLVRFLLTSGYRVRVLDNMRWGEESLLELRDDPALEIVKGDITNNDVLRPGLLMDVDGIVHLAAIVGDPACKKEPELAKAVNLEASRRLFALARSSGVKRFIFASTCSNYGRMPDPNMSVRETSPLKPVSLYAELKVAFENELLNSERESGFVPVALRFSTAYGVSPRMRFDLTVNEFVRDMYLGKELAVFGERFWRPYCHVRDLAGACVAALEAPAEKVAHEVFNVGDNGENYQKAMLVREIERFVPGARVRYVAKKEDPRDYRVDFTKIRETLGFRISRRVPDGIEEIIGVLKDNRITDPFAMDYQNC